MKRNLVISVILLVVVLLLTVFAGCDDRADCFDGIDFPKNYNKIDIHQLMYCAIHYDLKIESSAVYKKPIASCETFIDREKSLEVHGKLINSTEYSDSNSDDMTSSELLNSACKNNALTVLFKISATCNGTPYDTWDANYDLVLVYYVYPNGTVYEDDGFNICTYALKDKSTYDYLLSMAR